MNLIERLGLEKCEAIVEGAPDDAKTYSLILHMYSHLQIVTPFNWICLCDFRAALADHEKCQHEWNETTSNGDAYRFFVCKHCDSTRNFIPLNEDITDYVSDIRNHIAPTTKVIER